MFRPQFSREHSQLRQGFTLIEIMISIVIVAVLMSLLLPALGSVRVRAQIAQVHAEMDTFKASIAQFKTRFGVEPPSAVTIFESPADWALPANARSRRIVKQLWPQFDFGLARPNLDGSPGFTGKLDLSGAECLVFFLGGRVSPTSGAFIGFSKNPQDPFAADAGTADGPFFEFKGGMDVNSSVSPKPFTGRLVLDSDGDGFPVYLDSLPGQTKPYLYFSSYSGTDYRAADNSAWISKPYYSDAGERAPYNRDSFQLISPGRNYEYEDLPSAPGGGHIGDGATRVISENESDNIANFKDGTLSD